MPKVSKRTHSSTDSSDTGSPTTAITPAHPHSRSMASATTALRASASNSTSTTTTGRTASRAIRQGHSPTHHTTHQQQQQQQREPLDLSRDSKRERTKDGCLTCRMRRKKCQSERTPDGGCTTCHRLQIECYGFGAKRPEWMKDKDLVNDKLRQIKEHLIAKGFVRGVAKDKSQQSSTPTTKSQRSTHQNTSSNSILTQSSHHSSHSKSQRQVHDDDSEAELELELDPDQDRDADDHGNAEFGTDTLPSLVPSLLPHPLSLSTPKSPTIPTRSVLHNSSHGGTQPQSLPNPLSIPMSSPSNSNQVSSSSSSSTLSSSGLGVGLPTHHPLNSSTSGFGVTSTGMGSTNGNANGLLGAISGFGLVHGSERDNPRYLPSRQATRSPVMQVSSGLSSINTNITNGGPSPITSTTTYSQSHGILNGMNSTIGVGVGGMDPSISSIGQYGPVHVDTSVLPPLPGSMSLQYPSTSTPVSTSLSNAIPTSTPTMTSPTSATTLSSSQAALAHLNASIAYASSLPMSMSAHQLAAIAPPIIGPPLPPRMALEQAFQATYGTPATTGTTNSKGSSSNNNKIEILNEYYDDMENQLEMVMSKGISPPLAAGIVAESWNFAGPGMLGMMLPPSSSSNGGYGYIPNVDGTMTTDWQQQSQTYSDMSYGQGELGNASMSWDSADTNAGYPSSYEGTTSNGLVHYNTHPFLQAYGSPRIRSLSPSFPGLLGPGTSFGLGSLGGAFGGYPGYNAWGPSASTSTSNLGLGFSPNPNLGDANITYTITGLPRPQEDGFLYYFQHVSTMQYIFDKSSTATMHRHIRADPTGVVATAIRMIASVHDTQNRKANGLDEGTGYLRTNGTPEVLYKETLRRIFAKARAGEDDGDFDSSTISLGGGSNGKSGSKRSLKGRKLTEAEATAALHMISYWLFKGGDGHWSEALQIAVTWFQGFEGLYSTKALEVIKKMTPEQKFAAKTTMWMDIFSSITQLREPYLNGLYKHLQQSGVGNSGVSSDFFGTTNGCCDAVMLSLAQIITLEHDIVNHAELLSTLPEIDRRQQLSLYHCRANKIREDLENFDCTPKIVDESMSPEAFLVDSDALLSNGGPSSPPAAMGSPPSPSGSSATGKLNLLATSDIFRHAALVYLSTVQNGPDPNVRTTLQSVRDTHAAFLALPPSAVDKSLVFPLCIAGCMTDDLELRVFFRNRLKAMDGPVGNSGKTAMVMERVWARRDEYVRSGFGGFGFGNGFGDVKGARGKLPGWRDVMREAKMEILLV